MTSSGAQEKIYLGLLQLRKTLHNHCSVFLGWSFFVRLISQKDLRMYVKCIVKKCSHKWIEVFGNVFSECLNEMN